MKSKLSHDDENVFRETTCAKRYTHTHTYVYFRSFNLLSLWSEMNVGMHLLPQQNAIEFVQ